MNIQDYLHFQVNGSSFEEATDILREDADEEATDVLRNDEADEEATDVLRSDDADDSTAVLQGGRAASSVRMIKNVIIVHSDEEI